MKQPESDGEATRTVIDVFEATASRYGQRPAMRVKRGGAWQTITWESYRERVRRAARGFIELGVEPGTGVAIIGSNRPEWFIADLAAIAAGAMPAGIYTTNSPEQCAWITDHADARVAVVEDGDQLAKFLESWDQMPQLETVVLMEGEHDASGVVSWTDLLERGDGVPEERLDERVRAQSPHDPCTLIYTSGTTGPPKGVKITHRNITWMADTAMTLVEGGPDDRILSYLPLSHVAEQMMSLHGPIYIGACTWFAEGLEQLGDNLREVRPTYFFGVPRVWEKIEARMVAAAAEAGPLRKKLGQWARRVGLQAAYAGQERKPLPMTYRLADRLVFSKVRERLGLDQCKIQLSSAAPISKGTLEFFFSLGVPVYEVYGMSECTGPATLSLPDGRYRIGRAGYCLPGAELRIAEDGEICIRGPHVFAGYFKNDDDTRETLDENGWLYSGDVGDIDEDGFLRITDRKKDLIITAGGENIAPRPIEDALREIPVVSQAVVIGDRRKHLSALLALDPEQVASKAEAWGSPARTAAEAADCPTFQAGLQAEVDEVNRHLARVQTVKRWAMLPRELSQERGELTPTMKIKRRVVEEHYADVIESLYR